MESNVYMRAYLAKELAGLELVKLQHDMEKTMYERCLSYVKTVAGTKFKVEVSDDADYYILTVCMTAANDSFINPPADDCRMVS